MMMAVMLGIGWCSGGSGSIRRFMWRVLAGQVVMYCVGKEGRVTVVAALGFLKDLMMG